MDRIETILKKGGDGSLYLEERRTEILEVTEFSNTFKYAPAQVKGEDYLHGKVLKVINYMFSIEVYPKGRNSSTENKVLIKFQLYPSAEFYCRFYEWVYCPADWTYLVSIVDSTGRLKYTQSFKWIFEGIDWTEVATEWIQVVSADSLLREADVLLPDDTLTIQVDMVLKQYYAGELWKHITFTNLIQSSFGRKKTPSELDTLYTEIKGLPVRLDSPVGELLRQESRYFERLCATPMTEKNSGYVEISDEEVRTFMEMVKILSHPHIQAKCFSLFASIKKIFNVYKMAHLYGIEKVLDTCRCWLRLILRNHFSCLDKEDVMEISELAEFYDDSNLREIVAALARNEGEIETPSSVEHEHWTCERHGTGPVELNEDFSFVQTAKKEHVTEDVSPLSDCYI